MKKNILILSVIMIIAVSQSLFAQNEATTALPETYHIAIFAPLYLDSAFSNGQLNSDNSIPKFIMPAVDFVQGAHIALDTLNINGKSVDASIYDSKSYQQPISWLIKYKKLDNVNLIIGSEETPHDQLSTA